ncbi:predicted protein [Streptomyces viridosporus ATCC 14672]|uniref:Predicted protein n=1 Tax=Streptomyces viridosporus (strain ATCC 14672 / DSM 40746 / JCM 4963 / KCTC 9882 / NRRL B-12104 / FH 1290) TaxID=566461 RepID=D5ZUU7_STRV1|nr:predicted protein [Streptomyces viridosporus ATCC 14672]
MPAAIAFVATSGCAWPQVPSASFGPSGRRRTGKRAGLRGEVGASDDSDSRERSFR